MTRKNKNAIRSQDAAPKAAPKQTNDSFQNAQARLGWGTNNQSSASTYSLSYQSRNRVALEAAYRGSWIVAAAVDAVPEDMTRCGIEMSGLDPDDISAIETDMTSLGIWDRLCENGKWARLYGGSLAVMLIEGQDFSTPLRVETIAKGQFKGLLILDRWMVSPPVSEVVTEFGPDMGKPMFYDVIADYAGIPKAHIHYSRVIRMEGADLPFFQRISENGWGLSVLEPLWDRLIAFDSASVGAGQLIYKAHLRTMTIDGLRDIIASGGPALAGLKAQIEFTRLSQTNEGITVVDGKDKFETHTYTFAGLSDMLIQFAQQLSGATGIPIARLFGQSPTGLSDTGEGPRRQYHEKVHQKQEKELRTPLHRLLAVMSMSSLSKPLDAGFQFIFRGLDDTPEGEKADIATKKVDAVVNAVDANLIKPSTGMKELKASAPVTGMFGSISDADIAEAEEREKNEPPPGEVDLPVLGDLPQTKDSLFSRFFKK
jgi:phage-related protein (TIGR01555 family)